MTLNLTLFAFGYLVFFFGVFAFVSYIRKRLNKQRPPLEFEYIRAPGESLSKEIEKQTERLDFLIVLCLVVPGASLIIAFALIYFLYPAAPGIIWVPVCSAALVVGFVLACRVLSDALQEIRNSKLGLEGERVVADFLRPLEREGWRVFHDIPASNNGKTFNLDHVSVGSSGIALIETKSRRKGKCRKGKKDYVVTFDGRKLEWPWGSSKSELQQLKRQRDWLEKWILERIGKTIPVQPILALPGWWINSTNPKAVTKVVSHKSICDAVKGKGVTVLSNETIDLLARQLESLCRIKK